ncbi:RNA polymerase sigma-70 factor, ECF subfamily [Terrimicrobium sacchariphilum]|uniref:RNA polymerase sigma-70 factor, ECF subfamily n=1 Tax=Terrimicrobium sacchariphilum TaxID=690879 RepID=A0A146G899_TERSA|nr:RNA polymerase sigma-70 factor, ECF subfamily [Terrimicrobium sacchariphilum]
MVKAGTGAATEAHHALSHLCQIYWYPLYSFARRTGHSPDDAEDLTQEFFLRLLEGEWVASADRTRGRFRTFLLTAMKRFLANEWHRAHAQKRGGHLPILSLDEESAETRFSREPAHTASPDILYERNWALALLENVLCRLEDDLSREGKTAWADILRPLLTSGRGEIDYAATASQLGISEGAARVAVHRLRQRYRQLIRSEVAETVGSEDEVDEELRHLFQVLSGA